MSTNDTAGLGRRDLFRVGAGAATAVAASSTAVAQDDEESNGTDTQQDGGGGEGGGDGSDESEETAQDDGSVGEEGENPPAEQAGDGTLALFGVAGVLAFLSPLALVVLLYRQNKREEGRY